MGNRIIAAALAAIGVLAMASAITSWSSCWGAATSDACLAAADANAGMVAAAALWMAAILVAGIGLFSTSARPGSVISIVVLLLVNPLTDPGFIWAFDSADATPGRGVIGAVAILGGALLVTLVRHSDTTVSARVKAAEAI